MDIPIHIQAGDSTLVTFEGCGFQSLMLGSSNPFNCSDSKLVPCVQKVPFPGQVIVAVNIVIHWCLNISDHVISHFLINTTTSFCIIIGCLYYLHWLVLFLGCIPVREQCFSRWHPCVHPIFKNPLPYQCVSHRHISLHLGSAPSQQPAGTGTSTWSLW